MTRRLALVVGPPFQGCQALARALSAHAALAVVQDAHIFTPLAYLGYFDKVYKASYDHILAAEAQRLFVGMLPNGEADYVDACRAYCERLYEAVPPGDAQVLVDATPEYATVLPFIGRIFPEARYVVLTRHPLALIAARMPHQEVARYIRRSADVLDQQSAVTLRLRFEDFRDDPEATIEQTCDFLGVTSLPQVLATARQEAADVPPLDDWVEQLASSQQLRTQGELALRRIPGQTLRRYGYTPEHVWKPVETLLGRRLGLATSASLTRRTAQNLVITTARIVRRQAALAALVRKARLACDVLLRD